MTMISAGVALLLVLLTVAMHFLVLRSLARKVKQREKMPKRPLLMVVLALFVTHLAEVTLYALAFMGMTTLGLGELHGNIAQIGTVFDEHFYFSIASYTTLGIGDIYPSGPIRLVAGVEALNGLLLIAWSASFAYLVMEQFWLDDDPSND